MSNTAAVSVCVPIYNVEKYLERCLRSLFEQTLAKDVEFIFVNDCTPDNSMEILHKTIDDYPQLKNQIKIINHKTNQGVAITRNTALNVATGKYIIQVDSDDWVQPTYLEELYNAAEKDNADYAICGMNIFNGETLIPQEFHTLKSHSLKDIFIYDRNSLADKLFNRQFLIKNNISCSPNINLGEDRLFLIKVNLSTNKIAYVKNYLYNYNRINLTSYTHTLTNKAYLNFFSLYNSVVSFMNEKNIVYTDEDLNWLKIILKFYIITYSKFSPFDSNKKKIYMLWKECNEYAFRLNSIPKEYKLLFWFCNHKLYFCCDIILGIRAILLKSNFTKILWRKIRNFYSKF